MWNWILGINSFILWPASVIFFLYAVGRAILFLDWKLLIIAAVFVVLTTGSAVVFAMLSD
ncbi:MAG: hypothetical protein WC050_01950 [Candidatus Paceibacterota bacterium]